MLWIVNSTCQLFSHCVCCYVVHTKTNGFLYTSAWWSEFCSQEIKQTHANAFLSCSRWSRATQTLAQENQIPKQNWIFMPLPICNMEVQKVCDLPSNKQAMQSQVTVPVFGDWHTPQGSTVLIPWQAIGQTWHMYWDCLLGQEATYRRHSKMTYTPHV